MSLFGLLVLLVAPASFSLTNAQAPGSAGHHGAVQAGAIFGPLTRTAGRVDSVSAEVDNIARNTYDNTPAMDQHMSISPDGQYTFGYSAPTSSRQERRGPDGSVQGSYSYTDPTGKLVTIEYTADATSGFNAYGENVPPVQVAQAPYPVQDTPAVAEARAKFLEYYQQEWNARKALEAKENATARPLSPTSVPVVTLPDSAITVNGQPQGSYDDTGDDDSEIVSGFDEPSTNGNSASLNSAAVAHSAAVPVGSAVLANNSPLYTIQHQVGNKPGNGQTPYSGVSNSLADPGYFYYVGVGGLPYYVTSLPTKTNVAVSVRASQLGAIPVAAVHDSQRPNYGDGFVHAKQSPPVYVEVGQDYSPVGQSPVAAVNANNFRQVPPSVYQNKQSGTNYPINFPYHGLPVVVY